MYVKEVLPLKLLKNLRLIFTKVLLEPPDVCGVRCVSSATKYSRTEINNVRAPFVFSPLILLYFLTPYRRGRMRMPALRPKIVFGSLPLQNSHASSHSARKLSVLHNGRVVAGSMLNPVKRPVFLGSHSENIVESAFAGGSNVLETESLQSACFARNYSSDSFKRTIFSGIQPTGVLHLGNYFGAIRKWVELQEAGENVIYCIVDLHSITLPQDHKALHSQIISMAASLIACGIDPSKAILFQQSKVSEHSELNWVLGCLTTMARLGHLPQFKEKSDKLKEIPLGLYVYPVLQAADILLYRATHVPVGDDQRQHIQLAAHLARVFNNRFGQTFISPRTMVYDDSTSRIRSLRQPTKKMSKSEVDERSRIEITDSPESIREKFKKAVTDFKSEVYYDIEQRPGVSNIMSIHSAVTGKSYSEIADECKGIESAKYKLMVADAVIEYLRPIRTTYEDIVNDKGYIDEILEKGSTRARVIAQKTWQEVKQKVGLSR
ncbi:tryptophan--tRNA ligase, mitochondrial-like isoform X2 [Macrobrachium nipponense]|uniref:tryptophan--tRNA ligase, mitochondrial-like isoform X2 n=1 Tax=Macrobrachium nipponense TaxID=159736 RepID=UPI0030C85270